MVGEETLAGRAFVRDDHAYVETCARHLLGMMPEAHCAELEEILGRYRNNAERAVSLGGAWQRASLREDVRRDLFDLMRYALLHRDPDLASHCGRALVNIDRRSQAEASPGFDSAA